MLNETAENQLGCEPILSCDHPQVEKLVLVIHGVGDPEPGDTLGVFARSLAEDHHPLAEQQNTVWLPEKSHDPHFVKTFPAHVRELKNQSEEIELAEVFWGDLSRVWHGLPGTILGIFQILFGLRYVAYVAADQPGEYAYWLKRLGLLSSKILHGPVLAVTFVLAVLAIAVSGTHLMWADSYKSDLWTQIVLAGCCGFAIVASSIGWKLANNRIIERFWFWVNVTAMFVGGLMMIKAVWLDVAFPNTAFEGEIRPGLIWYCRVLVVFLGMLWFTEILVVIGMGICWCGALMNPKVHRPALHIAFLLPALSVGIWGQMLPMMWLAAKGGIKNLLKMPEFDKLFEEAIPLLGVQFLMLAVMSIAAGLIGYRYFKWRAKCGVKDFRNGARPPRLIVHGFVQSVLAICTITGVALVFGIGLLELQGFGYRDFWFGRVMAETNKYAMAILVPSSFMMVLLIPRLRPVFDIILDIVNHFHFRATCIDDSLDDEDEFDINETTFEQGTLFFSRRDAIHGRMKRILNYFRDKYEHRPELVVVSHSQGTMVAVEVLNDPELAWLKNRFSSVSLVTMGSPFSNLYQHYFAHLYPELDKPFWSSMRKRVDRWVNIFRIDDPVGTEIEFPLAAAVTLDCHTDHSNGYPDGQCEFRDTIFSNHPVGCRGHVSYWNDSEVLNILRAELFKDCSSKHDRHRHRQAG